MKELFVRYTIDFPMSMETEEDWIILNVGDDETSKDVVEKFESALVNQRNLEYDDVIILMVNEV